MSHKSDCATHNGPAMPKGRCDCGAAAESTLNRYEALEAQRDALAARVAELEKENGKLDKRLLEAEDIIAHAFYKCAAIMKCDERTCQSCRNDASTVEGKAYEYRKAREEELNALLSPTPNAAGTARELDTPYSIHDEYPTMLCDRHGGIVAQGVPPVEAALIVEAVNAYEGLKSEVERLKGALEASQAAFEAFTQGFMDGSIKWAKKRIQDSDPYHPANVLMCKAEELAREALRGGK